MAKYRKKPVVIDAMCVYPSITVDELCVFAGADDPPFFHRASHLYVKTLEGEMKVNWGDWLIKGVAGEFYPCKPAIFEATYEIVENQQ